MRLAFVALLVGCNAPAIEVTTADTGATDTAAADVATDTREPCKTVKFDGAVCEGHDEDDDCTPDDCHSCPNVPQDPNFNAPGKATAGLACSYLKPFDTITNGGTARDTRAGLPVCTFPWSHGWWASQMPSTR